MAERAESAEQVAYFIKESRDGGRWRVYSVNAFAVEHPASGWFADYDRAYERWLALRGHGQGWPWMRGPHD